jgi:PAS domain S-box-containing protein
MADDDCRLTSLSRMAFDDEKGTWAGMQESAMTEALVAAMMHSDVPMVLSDPRLPDCPMVAANQAFTALTGYTSEQIIGRNCRLLQGPNTDLQSRRRIRNCLEANQGCIEWVVNYKQSGEMFWNLLFLSPVHGPDGRLLYFFGSQFDITRGMPEGFDEISLGSAHVVPELEHEFHALLHEIASRTDVADDNVTTATRARALEGIVAAAHRLAEISTSLTPGTIETVVR